MKIAIYPIKNTEIGYREVPFNGRPYTLIRITWEFGYIEFSEFIDYEGKYSENILSIKSLLDFTTINVFPKYRGKGKTSIMMKAINRIARDNGFKGIYSCAYPLNEGMELNGLVKLLEKHGYKKEYENINPSYVGMLRVLNK